MKKSDVDWVIRAAKVKDVELYRDLRLDGLRKHPEVFGSDYETAAERPLEEWKERLRHNDGLDSVTFLACEDDVSIGTATIVRGSLTKTRHHGLVFGVYVRPSYRKRGVGQGLMEACTNWASQRGIKILKLAVVNTNSAAIQLYTRCGFSVYGVEPWALRVNNRYYDELLMACRLE
ncbi:MAG: GNAT family N-acetyltransferase [Ardenticatenaceae bacterium]